MILKLFSPLSKEARRLIAEKGLSPDPAARKPQGQRSGDTEAKKKIAIDPSIVKVAYISPHKLQPPTDAVLGKK